VTGRSFFPKLIEQPFASGLGLAFDFAAATTFVAAIASALRGKRYVHVATRSAAELAEAVAESAAGTGLPVVAEKPQLGAGLR